MPISPTYAFSARISAACSDGQITHADGGVVDITETELPDLLLDLAADGSGMPGRAKHHHRVLGEWFLRKVTQRPGSHLRLVRAG